MKTIALIFLLTYNLYGAKSFKEFFNNFKEQESIILETSISDKEELKNLDKNIENYLAKTGTGASYKRIDKKIKISVAKKYINIIKSDLETKQKHSIYFLEEGKEGIEMMTNLVEKTKITVPFISKGNGSLWLYSGAKQHIIEYSYFKTPGITKKDEKNLKEFIKTLKVEKGYKIYYGKEGYKDKQYYQTHILKNDLTLSMNLIKDFSIEHNSNYNSNYISIIFNKQGKNLFADITKRIAGYKLAIIIDGVIHSIPIVKEEISGGKASITYTKKLPELKNLLRGFLVSKFIDSIQLKK